MSTDLLDQLESVFSSASESDAIPDLLKQWDNWNDSGNKAEPATLGELPRAATIDGELPENDDFSELDFNDLWNRSLPVSEPSAPYVQSIAAVADNQLSYQVFRQKLKEQQVKRLATIPLNHDFEQSDNSVGAAAIPPAPVVDSDSRDNILSVSAIQASDNPNDDESHLKIAEPDDLSDDLSDDLPDDLPSVSADSLTVQNQPPKERESVVPAESKPEGFLSIIECAEPQEQPIPDHESFVEQDPKTVQELPNTVPAKVVKPKRKRSALRWSIVIGLTALFVGLVLFGRETYPRYLLLSGMKNVTNLKIQAGTIQEDYQRGTTSVSPVLVNDNLNQPLLQVKSASFSSLPVLLWKENRLDWIVLDGIEFCGAAIRRPADLPALKESPLQAEYELNLVKSFQPFVGTGLRNQAQERMKNMDQEVTRLTQQLGEELLLIQGNVKQLQESVSPDSNLLPGLASEDEKTLSPETAVQRSVEIRTQLKDAFSQWRNAKDRWTRQAENLLDDKNFANEAVAPESGLQFVAGNTAGEESGEECLLPGLPADLQTPNPQTPENAANNQTDASELAAAELANIEQPVGAQANAANALAKTAFQPQPQLFNEYLFGSVYKPFLNQFYQELIGFTQWLPELQNALKESSSVGKMKTTNQTLQAGANPSSTEGLFAAPIEISRDLYIGQIRLSGQIKFLGESQPFTGIVSNLNSRTPSRPTVVDLTFNSRYPSRLRLVVIPMPNDKQKITVEYYRPGSALIPQIGRPNGICLSFFRQKEQPTAEQSAAESAQPTRTDSVQMEIVDGQVKGEYRCVQNNIACELFIPGICSDEGLQKIHFLGARISGFELTAQLAGSLVSPQLTSWSNIESLETGAAQIAQAEQELQRLRFVQTSKAEWIEPLQKIADRINETQKKLESVVLVNRVVLDQTVQLCQNRIEKQNQEQAAPTEPDSKTPPIIPDLTDRPAQTEEELPLEQSQVQLAEQTPNAAPTAPAGTDYYQYQNPQTAENLNSDNPLR